ncbi:hypothetical protein BD311DRAFT_721757 [Dichomitus squalens]|uniref:Uncharacterized protein n=1 Tax=Dichomitus squalens TaxID=114155 RepID=A0A4Q9MQV2_9APHY|nr:hypothetical protein BD311DRAFT_721757 [Dichomitus squalens]
MCDAMVVDEGWTTVVQEHGDACASPIEPAFLGEGSRSAFESGSQSAETPLVGGTATLGDHSEAQKVRTTRTTDKVKAKRDTTCERRATRSMGQAEKDLADEQEVELMLSLEAAVDDEDGNKIRTLLAHAEKTDEKMEHAAHSRRKLSDLAFCLHDHTALKSEYFAYVDEQQTMFARMREMQSEVVNLAAKAKRLQPPGIILV